MVCDYLFSDHTHLLFTVDSGSTGFQVHIKKVGVKIR